MKQWRLQQCAHMCCPPLKGLSGTLAQKNNTEAGICVAELQARRDVQGYRTMGYSKFAAGPRTSKITEIFIDSLLVIL